jgi:hypothetical protein
MIKINKDLFEKIKIQCIKDNTSVKKLLTKLIEDYLSEKK